MNFINTILKLGRNMELIGWHGTTKIRKENILRNKFQYNLYQLGKRNQRIPNDLGAGVYFYLKFLDDQGFIIARRYVEKFKKSELIKHNTSVDLIKAEINTKDKFVLNLSNPKTQENLEKFRQIVIKELDEEFNALKHDGAKRRALSFNPRKDEGLLIEFLNERLKKDFKTSKDYFSACTKDTYTDLANLPRDKNGNNGKEICVRDIDIITIIDKEE